MVPRRSFTQRHDNAHIAQNRMQASQNDLLDRLQDCVQNTRLSTRQGWCGATQQLLGSQA